MKEYYRLEGGLVPIHKVFQSVLILHGHQWSQKEWVTSDAMKSKEDGILMPFVDELFDEDEYDLILNGWNNEPCGICGRLIGDSTIENAVNSGYHDDNDWVCHSCYELFLTSENPIEIFPTLEREIEE